MGERGNADEARADHFAYLIRRHVANGHFCHISILRKLGCSWKLRERLTDANAALEADQWQAVKRASASLQMSFIWAAGFSALGRGGGPVRSMRVGSRMKKSSGAGFKSEAAARASTFSTSSQRP